MHALSEILPTLPQNFSLPILIVQHLSPASDDYLATYLDEKCEVKVKEADEKEKIEGGVVYLVPANYHLLVEKDKTLSLSVDSPVNFARPSIDVLFETAAEAYGSNLIGLVLTGASADGSRGLKLIKERGGLTLVQDPKTAESEVMPKAAIAEVDVDHIIPLSEIGAFLIKIERANNAKQN